MPEPYTPPGSNVAYTVPSLDDPADAPVAFRDFADSIPPIGGPALVINKQSADYTLVKNDMAGVVEFDTTAGDLKVTIPTDANLDVPIGSVVVIANTGSTRKKRVTITPAQGVTIKDSADRDIQQYSLVSLIKIAANFWLINAGTAGGTGPTVPLPPTIAACLGTAEGVFVAWARSADDGGSAITSYVVEQSVNNKDWTQAAIVAATLLDTTIDGLTPGTTYYFRVKASNAVGFSEPSDVASAVPTNAYNDATGGTVSFYSSNGKFYRAHTFTSSGEFTVTKAVNPFDILVVAGGGGGGGGAGSGGGGAGGFYEKTGQVFDPIKYAITVGGPGTSSSINGIISVPGGGGGGTRGNGDEGGGGGSGGGGASGSGPGRGTGGGGTAPYGYGGGSAAYSQSVANGGGGGGAGGPGQNQENEFGGGAGGPGRQSSFRTGVAETYSIGGTSSGRDRPNGGAAQGYGGGGGGGGNSGNPGIVVIRYEVAPFNEATGGTTVQTIDDYNGTGQRWRVHTFTGNGQLNVLAAFKPFNILVVAGGAGGAGVAGNNAQGAGGGRGGAGGARFYEGVPLTDGILNVIVGAGGGGGDGGGQPTQGGDGGGSSIASYSTTGGGGGGIATGGRNGGSGGGGGCAVGNWGGPWGGGSGVAGEGTNGSGGSGNNDGSNAAGGAANLICNITGQNRTYANGDYGNGGSGGNWNTAGGPGTSGVVIVAYQVADSASLPKDEPTEVNHIDVARVSKVGDLVVSREVADDSWLGMDDPFFYWVATPDKDGNDAVIGMHYDPKTGIFEQRPPIKPDEQSVKGGKKK